MDTPRTGLFGGLASPRLQRPRPDHQLPPAGTRRALRIYFIKPSKYDRDGSLLEFRWGVIPSNTLIVLAGLNAGFAAARADIDLQTVLWDEVVDGALTGDLVDSIKRTAAGDGVELLVGLAGVQTNQYPRALDIALQFKGLGVPVVIGGFHVSSHAPSRQQLRAAGIAVVIGEAETTWPMLLDDYLGGRLQLSYQVTEGVRAKTGLSSIIVPPIEEAHLPKVDGRYVDRFFNPTFSTIDTSRGCPFVCSYCSVKNVMGRSMRSRRPEAVVDWIRDAHDRHGITNFLVVDDDFFRSPSWESILQGMAGLRREGRDLGCILQTDIESSVYADTCDDGEAAKHARSRRFVDLAAQAGCFEVFMGFESFSAENLERVAKYHNEDLGDRRRRTGVGEQVSERVKARYRRAVDNWHGVGVGVHCGYIIGMPFDAPGCGRRAARELADIGVDIASFFAYTPFPGTEDFDRAEAAGSIFDHDFNSYDSTRFVSRHPRMNTEELEREYDQAYRTFYSWRRLAWSLGTFHRVPGLTTAARYGMLAQQIYYTYCTHRGWHPMLGGIWRVRNGLRRRDLAALPPSGCSEATALRIARSSAQPAVSVTSHPSTRPADSS